MELIAYFIAALSTGTLLGWLLFKCTAAIYASVRKAYAINRRKLY
ncbi:hypothetical protein [Mucilaginibacter lacusdianchii]|nr:hypothetical protein [Mucilaginibacter sp. JXJ CY 39]